MHRTRNHFFLNLMASRALLLSQSGTYAGRCFTAIPTSVDVIIPMQHFRVLLLRRLRMPLPFTARTCRCGARLDELGDHRAACAAAGVLRPRAVPMERAAARICREAGARVAQNVFLRDMNVDVPVSDNRQIEVVANGLPLWGGAQVAVETTLVSPVLGDGAPHPGADQRAGIPCESAIRDKRERNYRELIRARRCRLQVPALEVGGRWDESALQFLRRLARARARNAPKWLRSSTAQAFAYR
jgi:hypothetical protein